MKTVGLIPAAGMAARLGTLPCSKEILPVPGADGTLRPLCADLLEAYAAVGIERVYVVLREGKWDIPAFLGSGADFGLDIAYRVTPPTRGVLETVDRAWPFVRDCRVALGFPDLQFSPREAFGALLDRAGEADVVLGLFPAQDPQGCDLVATDVDGRVTEVQIKPRRSPLRETWMLALWGPAFTELVHREVATLSARDTECHLGEGIRMALRNGLRVLGVRIPGGRCRDLGTPRALVGAWREGAPD